MSRRASCVGTFEVFEAAHVALRTLLAFSQPVNCIFWPIGMLNWLVAASKLHKHRETCCTAEWPFYSFLILCYEVWDTSLDSEEKLLLARAGIYNLITCTIRNHAQFAQTCCSATIRLSCFRCSAKPLQAAGGGEGSLSRDLNFVRFQMVE